MALILTPRDVFDIRGSFPTPMSDDAGGLF